MSFPCLLLKGALRHFSAGIYVRLRIQHGRACALLNSVQKFIENQGWLLLTFFICLRNQLSSFKNVIHQIDSKNEWLLLSITFTAKLELKT